jgi:hypothetical protein
VNWIDKFPWAKATIAVGLSGLVLFTLIAAFRLVLGKVFPIGFEHLIYGLVALTGVGGGLGIGKRATDYTLAAIKTGDAQTIASVVGPPKIPDSDAEPKRTDDESGP